MADSLLIKLVRNFPENGPKLLLENPANVRDLLTLPHDPRVHAIDFTAMTVERTHFVQPDYAACGGGPAAQSAISHDFRPACPNHFHLFPGRASIHTAEIFHAPAGRVLARSVQDAETGLG